MFKIKGGAGRYWERQERRNVLSRGRGNRRDDKESRRNRRGVLSCGGSNHPLSEGKRKGMLMGHDYIYVIVKMICLQQ